MTDTTTTTTTAVAVRIGLDHRQSTHTTAAQETQ